MKDFYAILGVLPSAEDVVIRAAWKALAQRYHPDRYGGNVSEANARMAEINEAYNILSDPAKRKAYDQTRNSKDRDFNDWVNEEEADQATNSSDPLEKDWQIAVEVYPDLTAINKRLEKISKLLAFTFRASMLELKAFEKRKELARLAEHMFLENYFGSNPVVLDFARQLIFDGNKDAAKALNESIRVLGSNVPADKVIYKICQNYGVETEEMRSIRLKKEARNKQREVEQAKKAIEAEAALEMEKLRDEAERERRLKNLRERHKMGFNLSTSEIDFLNGVQSQSSENSRKPATLKELPPSSDLTGTVSSRFALYVGVFLAPYIFAWFLLKKGHSPDARLFGFAWFIFVVMLFVWR